VDVTFPIFLTAEGGYHTYPTAKEKSPSKNTKLEKMARRLKGAPISY
jgi:hypothetical protein